MLYLQPESSLRPDGFFLQLLWAPVLLFPALVVLSLVFRRRILGFLTCAVLSTAYIAFGLVSLVFMRNELATHTLTAGIASALLCFGYGRFLPETNNRWVELLRPSFPHVFFWSPMLLAATFFIQSISDISSITDGFGRGYVFAITLCCSLIVLAAYSVVGLLGWAISKRKAFCRIFMSAVASFLLGLLVYMFYANNLNFMLGWTQLFLYILFLAHIIWLSTRKPFLLKI